MPVDDPRTFIQRYFTAVDEQRFDDVGAMFGPSYIAHVDSLPPMTRAEVLPFMGGFFGAFPDLRHRLEEVLVDGDRAAARIVIEGTHQGDLMGIPPTRRPVSFGATNVFHFGDGVIAEHWITTDTLGLLQQIGAVPAPEQ
jgi:predicted ester cyclase